MGPRNHLRLAISECGEAPEERVLPRDQAATVGGVRFEPDPDSYILHVPEGIRGKLKYGSDIVPLDSLPPGPVRLPDGAAGVLLFGDLAITFQLIQDPHRVPPFLRQLSHADLLARFPPGPLALGWQAQPGGFEAAAGTRTGDSHRSSQRGNQDTFAVAQGRGTSTAVVCDGASFGLYSEVGARLATTRVARAVHDPFDPAALLRDVLGALRTLAAEIDAEHRMAFVKECLYSTLVCVHIAELETTVWSIGNGVVILNDRVDVLHRHTFVASGLAEPAACQPMIEVHPTAGIQRVAICTDGVRPAGRSALLVERMREAPHRMAALATEHSDDTTMVCLRRRR